MLLKLKIKILVLSILSILTLTHCTVLPELKPQNPTQHPVADLYKLIEQLDNSGHFPTSETQKQNMIDRMARSLTEFDKTPEQANNDWLLSRYKTMLRVNESLTNKFYSYAFQTWLDNNSTEKINREIATLYADKARNTSNPAMQEKYYKDSLEYTTTPDLQQSYNAVAKNNAATKAEKAYQAGLISVKNNKFEIAASQFSSANSAYRAWGEYKDSEKLRNKYQDLFYEESREDAFQKAQQARLSAKFKYEYRKADYYYRSVLTYSSYLDEKDYKNSAKLAKEMQIKGQVKVYISYYTQISPNQCGGVDFKKLANISLNQAFGLNDGAPHSSIISVGDPKQADIHVMVSTNRVTYAQKDEQYRSYTDMAIQIMISARGDMYYETEKLIENSSILPSNYSISERCHKQKALVESQLHQQFYYLRLEIEKI